MNDIVQMLIERGKTVSSELFNDHKSLWWDSTSRHWIYLERLLEWEVGNVNMREVAH